MTSTKSKILYAVIAVVIFSLSVGLVIARDPVMDCWDYCIGYQGDGNDMVAACLEGCLL